MVAGDSQTEVDKAWPLGTVGESEVESMTVGVCVELVMQPGGELFDFMANGRDTFTSLVILQTCFTRCSFSLPY